MSSYSGSYLPRENRPGFCQLRWVTMLLSCSRDAQVSDPRVDPEFSRESSGKGEYTDARTGPACRTQRGYSHQPEGDWGSRTFRSSKVERLPQGVSVRSWRQQLTHAGAGFSADRRQPRFPTNSCLCRPRSASTASQRLRGQPAGTAAHAAAPAAPGL